MNKRIEVKEKITVFALLILLLGLIGYMEWCNFAKLVPRGLDSDLVNEIRYRQLSWEQKSLFPEGFYHCHELYSSRPVLLYWLFYAITNDFMFSYQLENSVMFLILLASLWFLMGALTENLQTKLLTLCIFIGWMPKVEAYVLFFPSNCYVLFAIATFLSLGFRFRLIRQEKWLKSYRGGVPAYISILCMCGIAAYLGYSSPRLILTLYLPLICIDLLKLFFSYLRAHTFPIKALRVFLLDLVLLGISAVMYMFAVRNHGDCFYPEPTNIASISSWFNWTILSTVLRELGEALGIRGGGKLVSSSGLSIIVSAAFVLLALLSAGWGIYKYKERKEKGTEEIVPFALIVTMILVLLRVTALQAVDSNPRYYYCTALLFPVVCSLAIEEWSTGENGKQYSLPFGLISLATLIMFSLTWRVYFSSPVSTRFKVAEYMKENGYGYVTASYWNAGVMRGYTNGAVEAQHLEYLGNTPRYWMTDSRMYTDERLGEPEILLLTDAEEKTIYDSKNGIYWMLETEAKKVQEIDIYNLYELHENPFTLLPKVEERRREEILAEPFIIEYDYPGNGALLYANGTVNPGGSFASDGTCGFIATASHSDLEAGTYNLVLHYRVKSYEGTEQGVFDVLVDNSGYRSVPIQKYAFAVRIEDVAISKGQTLTLRVWVPDGMKIEIESVEYQRKNT